MPANSLSAAESRFDIAVSQILLILAQFAFLPYQFIFNGLDLLVNRGSLLFEFGIASITGGVRAGLHEFCLADIGSAKHF